MYEFELATATAVTAAERRSQGLFSETSSVNKLDVLMYIPRE